MSRKQTIGSTIIALSFMGWQATSAQVVIQELMTPARIIYQQPVTQSTVVERTIVTPAQPAVTTTQSTISVADIMRPGFISRLQHLQEHIAFGQGRGWVSSMGAEALRAEHARVASQVSAARADGVLTSSEIALVEQELTRLSTRITDAFNQRSIAGSANYQ